MKRYDMEKFESCGAVDCTMQETKHGDWVRYHDLSDAIKDVIAERYRQIHDEGFDADHDDRFSNDEEIPIAAAVYAMPRKIRNFKLGGIPLWETFWPWDKSWFKPRNRTRDLTKAAALLIAEIERIDRSNLPQKQLKPFLDKIRHLDQ